MNHIDFIGPFYVEIWTGVEKKKLTQAMKSLCYKEFIYFVHMLFAYKVLYMHNVNQPTPKS